MRRSQILWVALMLAGTVGCSTQVPGTTGLSVAATHNNGNKGEWSDSGNATQSNSAKVAVGGWSAVNVDQQNEAAGGSSQQIGDDNTISTGDHPYKGKGSSSNDDNQGDWDNSGNSTQNNNADVYAGAYSKVDVWQENQAVGGAAQQIGDGNKLSSDGKKKSPYPDGSMKIEYYDNKIYNNNFYDKKNDYGKKPIYDDGYGKKKVYDDSYGKKNKMEYNDYDNDYKY
jgi:hypothetical protein